MIDKRTLAPVMATCASNQICHVMPRQSWNLNEVEKVTTAHTIKLKAEINAIFDRHVTVLEQHRPKLLEESKQTVNAVQV